MISNAIIVARKVIWQKIVGQPKQVKGVQKEEKDTLTIRITIITKEAKMVDPKDRKVKDTEKEIMEKEKVDLKADVIIAEARTTLQTALNRVE